MKNTIYFLHIKMNKKDYIKSIFLYIKTLKKIIKLDLQVIAIFSLITNSCVRQFYRKMFPIHEFNIIINTIINIENLYFEIVSLKDDL